MCFRPPSAEAGEVVCPSCFIVGMPDAEGKCSECGAVINTLSNPSSPAAPTGAPSAPKPPKAPGAPGIPRAPK